MKKLKLGALACVTLAVISLAACKKNGVSPSSTTPQMSFQVKADNLSTDLASTSQGSTAVNTITGLTWTSGIANISQFKLEAKKNGVETEIQSRNLTNVDLFAANPSIANVTLDTGTYREIEISVVFQKSPDASALPLKLNGTFTTGGGTVIPIEFDFNDNAVIKTEGHNITVTSSTDFVALVHLHLGKLEAGITAADLDNATLTNGTIVISRTSNASIYNRVLNNLGNCGESEFNEHNKGGHGDNGNDGNGNNGNSNSGSNGILGSPYFQIYFHKDFF
jgi:hypothetical protein